jgi:hypothetical protein
MGGCCAAAGHVTDGQRPDVRWLACNRPKDPTTGTRSPSDEFVPPCGGVGSRQDAVFDVPGHGTPFTIRGACIEAVAKRLDADYVTRSRTTSRRFMSGVKSFYTRFLHGVRDGVTADRRARHEAASSPETPGQADLDASDDDASNADVPTSSAGSTLLPAAFVLDSTAGLPDSTGSLAGSRTSLVDSTAAVVASVGCDHRCGRSWLRAAVTAGGRRLRDRRYL